VHFSIVCMRFPALAEPFPIREGCPVEVVEIDASGPRRRLPVKLDVGSGRHDLLSNRDEELAAAVGDVSDATLVSKFVRDQVRVPILERLVHLGPRTLGEATLEQMRARGRTNRLSRPWRRIRRRRRRRLNGLSLLLIEELVPIGPWIPCEPGPEWQTMWVLWRHGFGL